VPGEVSPRTSGATATDADQEKSTPVSEHGKPLEDVLAEAEAILRDTTTIPVHEPDEERKQGDNQGEEGDKPKYFQDTHDILEELEVHATSGGEPKTAVTSTSASPRDHEEDTETEESSPVELPPFLGVAVPVPVDTHDDNGEWKEKYEEELKSRQELEKVSTEQTGLIKKLQTQLAEETRLKRLAEESAKGLKESLSEASDHIGRLEAELSKTKNIVMQLQSEVMELKKNATLPEEKLQRAQETLMHELQASKQELAQSLLRLQQRLAITAV